MNLKMAEMSVYDTRSDCTDNPQLYKICSQWTCVPVNISCPCRSDEFGCSDDTCVSGSVVCDGVKNCRNGHDELFCTDPATSDPLAVPLPVFITVIVTCVLLCFLTVCVIYFCLRRRYLRTNGSMTSNELLQKPEGKDSNQHLYETKVNLSDNQGQGSENKKEHQHRNYGYDLLPQDLGLSFGEEFLGTSTPKQGIKHIISTKTSSGNLKVIDSLKVNDSLKREKISTENCENRKSKAIGDSASDLNSLFISIT